jgi:hypothetical protein
MCRSAFSTTTMASSTTMPMARMKPNMVSAFSVKPSASSTAKVPTMETGMASSGITAARQFCRNSTTTSTTSSTASAKVWSTASMLWAMKRVGSYTTLQPMPEGKLASASSMVRRTAAAVSSALLPGRWKMTMAVATWLFSSALTE